MFGSEKPPDRLLPWQTASCPSEQLFGEIQLNAGVVALALQVVIQAVGRSENRLAMCAALQSPDCRIDSNHGNGKCLGTYWSVALAEPGFG